MTLVAWKRSIARIAAMVIMSASSFFPAVDAMPYILLKNKAPKCFQVETPSHTRLTITYHAPDMIIIPDDGSETKEPHIKPEDGMDARFNERFQKRMETLKRAHLKDINISIVGRDASGGMLQRVMLSDVDVASPRKKRVQLDDKEGSFEYDTGDMEESVEVCVQSYTATADNPSRVAFRVKPQADDTVMVQLSEAGRKLQNELLEIENKVVKDETSRITAELVRMQRRAKTISGDAQFSKQREELFHSQSISLNQAVKYWPIIRMVVILIGGYFQVTHVVNYMKSRHIY